MDKRLLNRDPLTGIEEWFHYDSLSDTTYVETIQDVEPVLEMNKQLQNDDDVWKKGVKGSWAMYASIPLVVQMRWLNEYGLKNWPMLPENKELLFRLLNSRDWGYLKCTGKIHAARG